MRLLICASALALAAALPAHAQMLGGSAGGSATVVAPPITAGAQGSLNAGAATGALGAVETEAQRLEREARERAAVSASTGVAADTATTGPAVPSDRADDYRAMPSGSTGALPVNPRIDETDGAAAAAAGSGSASASTGAEAGAGAAVGPDPAISQSQRIR